MNTSISLLLISLALGSFIGLQFRKKAVMGDYHDKAFAGLRTCMAISLLGTFSVILQEFYVHTLLMVSAFFFILMLINYTYSTFRQKRQGATTELSLVMLFLVGIMVGYEQTALAMVLTVLLSIIASARDYLYQFSDRWSQVEIIETIKFAIVVFLIYPLLPNEAIDPWGIFNPALFWLMVILILGISFFGYVIAKFMGKKKGIILSGVIGGLVSSTAVTTTMAIESKGRKGLTNVYSTGLTLGTLMMVVRVLIVASIINAHLFSSLVYPLSAMAVSLGLWALYCFLQKAPQKRVLKKNLPLQPPLAFKPAISFSLFFLVILALTRFAELYLGDSGVYFTSVISGVADVDAITLSLSQLSSSESIATHLAVQGITLAVMTNILIKIAYVKFFGSEPLTRQMALIFGSTALLGVVTFLWF